ncbi:MAG TPA: four helix bundle protein [Tepidisphaeraceae bacterium]|jgi:four helix bundle protein
MAMRNYRELDVWKKSMDLVEQVYELTKALPREERYGLISQIQRAAVSIPANIAEGYGRAHRAEYLQHLAIARGSLFELETLLTLTVRLNLVAREDAVLVWPLAQDVGKMLHRLTTSLKKSVSPPKPGTRTPRPEHVPA